jgi:signal transduction histidine kinase
MIRISLKNKLFVGFGFLFFMIILLWMIGGFFIYNLANRSAAMLKENYQTVESTKFLIQSIDEIKNQQIRYFFGNKGIYSDSIFKTSKELFDSHLIAAGNNVTEEGEQRIINQLDESYIDFLLTFERLRSDGKIDSVRFFSELIPSYTMTRNLIVSLWDMNMKAISYKNTLLKSTAHRAFVLMSLIGTICFIISALFFFRYPGNIANPIREFTKGITEIANRNYSQRLSFRSNDELGELAEAFNIMAARLDEYEHSNLSELLFEKKRIEKIINKMNDAIIGLNEKNEIIFSNTYACRIMQVEQSALPGKYAPDIAKQNAVFNSIMQDIIENSVKDFKDFKPLRLTVEKKVRYFAREILEVNISKTVESKPERAGIVVVLKNITRFLEQDEAKTNFMATISHELKTPISSLRLNLKLLDDARIGILNEEQKEIVHALKFETDKMLSITTELLDLAQVETGKIQFNLQQVSSSRLFEYIKEIADSQAKSKQIRISFSAENDLPSIYADLEKTSWVLINLINNAIQYSDNGSEIMVSASGRNNDVIFMVQDYGKGIEEQYLEPIFEKFFRVPDSGEKGTGLGLAISKELITRQNGRIWAESNPGKGSRFFFSLPVFINS